MYRVAQDRRAELLRGNPQCTRWGLLVACPTAAVGNYGQVRVGQAVPTGSALAPAPYVVPSAPPPLGVPAARQAEADQLWARADGLIQQNRYRDSMPILIKCGNMGHKRCQAMLGIIFQEGRGTKSNDRAAAYWFSAAAAQGHRAAQYSLGGMYEEGEGGLPKDLHKATELYIKSANQGFDRAQFALGIQYELGQEVTRSRPKALELLRASGDQDALWMAQLLANPKTPARFANEMAFGDYLAGLRNDEFAASWAKARASWGGNGGSGKIDLYQAMEHGRWVRAGGNDNNHNPYRQ